MEVDIKDVEYIAELARLKFTEEEKESLKKDMNNVLEYVKELQELDTENTEVLVNPLYIENRFREDEIEEGIEGEKFLENAPDRLDDYLRVPKVIEVEDGIY